MTLTDISLALLVILLAVFVIFGMALSERRLGASLQQIQRRSLIYALVLSGWLLLSAMLAAHGAFGEGQEFPPKPGFLIFPTVVLLLIFIFSGPGTRLTRGLHFSELIGFQAFRLPVELILLGYYFESRVPLAMTLEGRNFDVLSAVSATVVAPLVFTGILGRRAIWIWNVLSFALLLNIIFVAASSLAIFSGSSPDPVNSLPFHWPSVWIVFCVLLAFCSHFLIFRKLRQERP